MLAAHRQLGKSLIQQNIQGLASNPSGKKKYKKTDNHIKMQGRESNRYYTKENL